jgi:hypothetical protein
MSKCYGSLPDGSKGTVIEVGASNGCPKAKPDVECGDEK